MTEQPYTLLSMSIDPGERPRIRISLCGSIIRARARVLESGRPYLALESEAPALDPPTPTLAQPHEPAPSARRRPRFFGN